MKCNFCRSNIRKGEKTHKRTVATCHPAYCYYEADICNICNLKK